MDAKRMISFPRLANAALTLVVMAVLVLTSQRVSARQSIPEPPPFDEKAALEYSQAAIGRDIPNLEFINRYNKKISLAQFRGKPLIINMIYTSCFQTCPTIVESLYDGVKIAQNALGEDRFSVVTIGFDAKSDTPERMRGFASTRGVSRPNWHFLSGTSESVTEISNILGFIYVPSPVGFDHLTQTTVIDSGGKVYAHVYGASFPPPAVVEPLKELVFGRKKSIMSLEGLSDRVRLFCTIYDPRNGRYYFDYSIFIGLFIGLMILGTMAVVLIRNVWRLWRGGNSVA
ncbi:MAG: SCO family protein [bacterium]|nr:SCO family protein [bacterium]